MSVTAEQLDKLVTEADCAGLSNGEIYCDARGVTLECHETDVAPDAWCVRCMGASLGWMLQNESDRLQTSKTKLLSQLSVQLEQCHACSAEARCHACRCGQRLITHQWSEEGEVASVCPGGQHYRSVPDGQGVTRG